ncbi:uncharacterized protein [Dysidea avara]
MADDEWTQFISHQRGTVSCRTSWFYRLSVYNICSVSFLQWQLLPLKNLVATMCGLFGSFFTELFKNYRLGLSSRRFFVLLTSLTAATSSGTVNELSAFKNLFHLVCPYFTDHAHIANKILFQLYLVITRFLDLVISVSDASCELTYTLAQQSHILSGCFMSG